MSKFENKEIEEFQEYSDIDLFNKIGDMAKKFGYVPIYFKVLKPKISNNEDYTIDYKEMHYIHLCKGEILNISIYYDKYNIYSLYPKEPYYGLKRIWLKYVKKP